MDTLIGFITELTAEKRGPAKRYRRFNFNTLNQQNISGWVFSTIDIEDTASGKIILQAAKNNSAVQIYGKLTQEQGIRYDSFFLNIFLFTIHNLININ